MEQFPFSPEEIAAAEAADPQAEHQYIFFLEQSPLQAQIDSACKDCEHFDMVRMGNRVLYLLCRQSIRLSKTTAHLSKMFDTATVRNRNSVCNIYEMLKTI